LGDWQTACTEYGAALTICQALGSGGGSSGTNDESKTIEDLELRDFFTSRAQHVIQPVLRYCQYELQEGGIMTEEEILNLMKSSQQDTETELQNQLVTSKLASIQEQKLQNEALGGSMSTIHFRSNDVPVDNKNVRVALLKIANFDKELQNCGKNSKKKEQLFLQLLTAYDDAISLVSEDLKEYQNMKRGPAVNTKRFECCNLLGFVSFEKLKLCMKRNEDMVNDLREEDCRIMKKNVGGRKKVDEASNGGSGGEDENSEAKRVEEIAHLYDALLQDARSVSNLPGGGDVNRFINAEDGASAADNAGSMMEEEKLEDEFLLEANANVLRLRALRCYYVARLYASSTLEKYVEASKLFEQALTLSVEAAEEIGACQDMDGGEEYMESMEALEKEIKGAKFRAEACAYLARSGGGSTTKSSSSSKSSGGGGGVVAGRSLLSRLDDFDSGGKTFHLVDVPPHLEPIPCKPTFFDIALNHVGEFPMEELQMFVDEYSKEKQEQQRSGGILGWFRRG